MLKTMKNQNSARREVTKGTHARGNNYKKPCMYKATFQMFRVWGVPTTSPCVYKVLGSSPSHLNGFGVSPCMYKAVLKMLLIRAYPTRTPCMYKVLDSSLPRWDGIRISPCMNKVLVSSLRVWNGLRTSPCMYKARFLMSMTNPTSSPCTLKVCIKSQLRCHQTSIRLVCTRCLPPDLHLQTLIGRNKIPSHRRNTAGLLGGV